MPTTQIATENARPSLKQDIETLYANQHTGGAYDTKKELVTNGKHNEIVIGIQSQKHTPKGFKTKMAEQQTELFMAQDNTVVTTRMKTSIYGNHSTVKYKR